MSAKPENSNDTGLPAWEKGSVPFYRGKRNFEKFLPFKMAFRSTSTAESSQPFCSRKIKKARVLTLRHCAGSKKLVRAIL
jgi:hypothetical protein